MRKITQMVGREKICLVFTNQLRQKLGVMFGDPWTTSGGKTTISFFNSYSIKEYGTDKGHEEKYFRYENDQIIKNRLGKPLRHLTFNLYFDSGIDDKGSWLQVMKDHKLVKQGGSWYTSI